MIVKVRSGSTHACHELEHGVLSLIEKLGNFVQTRNRGLVISNCAGHTASQSSPQRMIYVEFARRTGSEERIVKTWLH